MCRFLALFLLVASSCHARIVLTYDYSDVDAFLEQIEYDLSSNEDDDELRNFALRNLAETRNALKAVRTADKKSDSAKLKLLIDDFHKRLRILEGLYRRVKCSEKSDLGRLSSVGDPASLIIRLSCPQNSRKIKQDRNLPIFFVGKDRSAPSGGVVSCSFTNSSSKTDFEHPPSVP